MAYLMEPSSLEAFLSAKKGEFSAVTQEARSGVISVVGVLVPQESLAREYRESWGIPATSYESISAQLKQPGPVTLMINSGGGQTEGCDALMKEINSRGKTTAIVQGMAASAAYGIASQCEKVYCSSEGDLIGSVGVAVDTYLDPNRVSITSSDAPDKRPDLTTEEGKKVVQGWLDGIHELFVEQIAKGRGISPEKVNSDFGRGGLMTARQAVKTGMFDGYISTDKKKSRSKSKMELSQLKAEHPEAYAAAVQEERGRVKAHIDLGKACGDMDLALKNISEGAELSLEIQAAYTAANLRRESSRARASEDPKSLPTAKAPADFWDGVK